MTWTQTRDGHAISLVPPIDITTLSIEEVAHSLARLARFSGHTRGAVPYSVAQHSVHVAEHLSGFGQQVELDGLLHDAHEALLGDITSPVKSALRHYGGGYALDELDNTLAAAIHDRFGGGAPGRHSVKVVDLRMLATERRDLLGKEAKPWLLSVDGATCEPYAERIVPWYISQAEEAFLERYNALLGAQAG